MELPSYFTRFLQEIQPKRYSRELAIQLHTTLRKRLSTEVEDDTFSNWFNDSFLYGSYIRNTALQPIKDVDVCLILDLSTEEYSPEMVVRRLKSVLEQLGYEDKTAYQRRSVRIDMSKTTLDAVPVVAVNGKEEALLVPDRKLKEWISTHPKAHIEAATQLNKKCGGRYIPFVKIVKSWFKFQAAQKRKIERPQPKGFTLEAMVAQYQDPDAPTYAEAFIHFLRNILNSCGDELRQGEFPQVRDPGLPNEFIKLTLDSDEVGTFLEIIEESLEIAELAINAKTIGESADLWRQVFGPKFPEAPSAMKSMTIDDVEDDTLHLVDPILELEVTEVDLPLKVYPENVTIKAQLAPTKDNSKLKRYLPSGARAAPKNWYIKFTIERTSVLPPFDIRWTVENHGKEAIEAGDITHSNMTTFDQRYRWEHTQYRGAHFMICEIIKDGVIVAQVRYTVNVR
jgi:hypothetical protein